MEISIPTPTWERRIPVQDGVCICCRCFGDDKGEPLLLLHGNGEDYRVFARQLESFSQQFRVLTIDSRGHGSSDMGQPFTLLRMAEDICVVMDTLKIPKASVVGFSDGGNVALLLALGHASRVKRLVLAGANMFPSGMKPKLLRRLRLRHRLYRLLGRMSKRMRTRQLLLELMLFQPNLDPWELESVDAPTLVLAGEHDCILESHTRLLASSIPNAHLRILPSCDHFLFKQQPVWASETILKFLLRK